jgi:azurin
MKNKALHLFAALLLASAPVLFSSCNGGTNENNTGNNAADTTHNMSNADTSSSVKPDEIAKGTTIDVKAFGNDMSDMHYNYKEIHVPANTNVTIHLMNVSKNDAMDMKHNFVIVKPENVEKAAIAGAQAGDAHDFIPKDSSLYIAHSSLTKPGESVEFTFKTPAAGEYKFICTYTGHYQKMQGRFIVE